MGHGYNTVPLKKGKIVIVTCSVCKRSKDIEEVDTCEYCLTRVCFKCQPRGTDYICNCVENCVDEENHTVEEFCTDFDEDKEIE